MRATALGLVFVVRAYFAGIASAQAEYIVQVLPRDTVEGRRVVVTWCPLQRHRLTRVVAHPAFWFGWYGFFPHAAIWRRSR